MTTSDDDDLFDDPNESADQPVDLDSGLDDSGMEGDGDAAMAEPVPPARWPLAILASLGAAVIGVVLWALIYANAEREYVGVSVVIGLTIGWLMRVVSRRSTIAVRIVAVVITALACVAGTVVGEVAYTSKAFKFAFWTLLKDVAPDTFKLLSERPGLTYGIFVAALVLAFLSAGPQKPKASKLRGDPTPVAPVDEPGDAPLASGDD